MILSKDTVIQRDVEEIAESNMIDWKQFSKATILVTGASGLIGRQLVYSFLFANSKYELNLRVIAMVHNMEKAWKIFELVLQNKSLMLVQQDINEKIEINEDIDYIIHGASITASKAFVTKPVETIHTAIFGCKNILELAKDRKIRSGVYLSSMEVYGKNEKGYLNEMDYGYLDHVAIRSSYSESKKMCECLCSSYFHEYGIPIKIVRLTQTFGPGVEKDDNRVFAQFANAIIDKKDIVLYSKGETVRNYCYTKDAILGILTVLLKGKDGEAYNVANEDTEISILEMANMVAEKMSNGYTKVVIQLEDAEKHGFNPTMKVCIQCDKLKQLGWKAEVGLEEAYIRMIQSMEQKMCAKATIRISE